MTERIVVLDGHTLNPGDLDWSPFAALGRIDVHARTAEGDILARARGASCVLTNKTPLTRESIAALPDLRYIGVLATGYNVVDLAAAKARGIAVTNIPTYGTDSVAQHAAAMMLEYARGLGVHDRAVKAGEWSTSADWCFARRPVFELTGRTLGLVGIGRIGLALARIAAAMGMRLAAHDPFWPDPARLGGLVIEPLDLDDVFRQADVISLHCPLTADNHHLVNRARIALMKRDALIVNTSRGPLIDPAALADALRAGAVGGAALDVLDVEPPPASNPLLGAPNCLITPHIAWYAIEARRRLLQTAADNLAAFLAGRPVNVVG
jgi:glycerate dehydrogenase